jgi:hypothetical protein
MNCEVCREDIGATNDKKKIKCIECGSLYKAVKYRYVNEKKVSKYFVIALGASFVLINGVLDRWLSPINNMYSLYATLLLGIIVVAIAVYISPKQEVVEYRLVSEQEKKIGNQDKYFIYVSITISIIAWAIL